MQNFVFRFSRGTYYSLNLLLLAVWTLPACIFLLGWFYNPPAVPERILIPDGVIAERPLPDGQTAAQPGVAAPVEPAVGGVPCLDVSIIDSRGARVPVSCIDSASFVLSRVAAPYFKQKSEELTAASSANDWFNSDITRNWIKDEICTAHSGWGELRPVVRRIAQANSGNDGRCAEAGHSFYANWLLVRETRLPAIAGMILTLIVLVLWIGLVVVPLVWAAPVYEAYRWLYHDSNGG